MTKLPRLLPFLLPLCAVVLHLFPVSAAGQQITITGVVIDSAARSPVTGAMVTLNGSPRILTDADGVFRFVNQRAGVFDLSARRTRLIVKHCSVSLTA